MNIYETLTPPVGNGVGAKVDISGMKAFKTVSIGISTPAQAIEIQVSNSLIGGEESFYPVADFDKTSNFENFTNNAFWARMVVSGFVAGDPQTQIWVSGESSSSENGSNLGPLDVLFEPGNPAGSVGSIVTTWAEVMALIGAMPVSAPKNLYLSAFYGDVIIPGLPHSLPNVIIGDTPNGGRSGDFADFVNFTLEDGCALLDISGFNFMWRNWTLINKGTGIPPIIIGNGFKAFNLNASSQLPFTIAQSDPGNTAVIRFENTGFSYIAVGAFVQLAAPGSASVGSEPAGIAPTIEVMDTAFANVFFRSGALQGNALVGAKGAVMRLITLTSPLSSMYSPDNQPEFLGTLLTGDTLNTPRMNALQPSDAPTAVPHNALQPCLTAAAPVAVPLRTARHRRGEEVVIKDASINAGANPITITAHSNVIAALAMTFVADDGSGESAVDGQDFRAAGFRPGDSVVFTGTALNNVTATLSELTLTGARFGVAALVDEAAVVSTATQQDLIDGAITAVIGNNSGALRLQVSGRDTWLIVAAV